MLESLSPFNQTILSTFFTWGMTALGALCCVLHYAQIESRYLLDGSLGFSAGVMLAASYWSLLSPAEEMALQHGYGQWSFIPLTVGLLLGAGFVMLADRFTPPSLFMPSAPPSLSFQTTDNQSRDDCCPGNGVEMVVNDDNVGIDSQVIRQRHTATTSMTTIIETPNLYHYHHGINPSPSSSMLSNIAMSRRRLVLLIVAITIHNVPEGLAVGVAFGAVGQSKIATVANARNLALGIGIQNFPEGLAVSLPLKASGMSLARSVWYGQLSGLVEPLAGLFGCLAVRLVSPLLPYALAFAAGAMIFVVIDDIIPETQQQGNGKLASICGLLGFVVMMSLDMSLG